MNVWIMNIEPNIMPHQGWRMYQENVIGKQIEKIIVIVSGFILNLYGHK